MLLFLFIRIMKILIRLFHVVVYATNDKDVKYEGKETVALWTKSVFILILEQAIIVVDVVYEY